MKKRLYKSRKDKKMLGVLGGVSEYFGIDSSLLRIVFLVLLIFTGGIPLIILYFLSDWVLPFEDEVKKTNTVE